MKKTKIEIKTVHEEKVITLLCNRCGKKHDNHDHIDFSDIESFSHTFGYGTTLDGTKYEFDLCEDCFKEIISDFKIKPEIKEMF